MDLEVGRLKAMAERDLKTAKKTLMDKRSEAKAYIDNKYQDVKSTILNKIKNMTSK